MKMNKELKDAIIKAVQESVGEFQLHNTIIEKFRSYIYDSNGDYLISGEKVAQFINNFIELYTND